MEFNQIKKQPVLIAGNGKLAHSVVLCFLQSQSSVIFYTEQISIAEEEIDRHIRAGSKAGYDMPDLTRLKICDTLPSDMNFSIVVALTNEDAGKKRALIKELEQNIPKETTLAINTESIPLRTLQDGAVCPERIIGLNWTEPAHLTYFLEIIGNERNDGDLLAAICQEAKKSWSKDPYLIKGELGIRSKMMAAMVREAFYLVQEGYATGEDIDRACRNDPGYYLPFSGNFRYIDLMGGPVLYGKVMKDLNPVLAKSDKIPEFFEEAVKRGNGLEDGKGLYEYAEGDQQKEEEMITSFSYKVKQLMDKYPFGDAQ